MARRPLSFLLLLVGSIASAASLSDISQVDKKEPDVTINTNKEEAEEASSTSSEERTCVISSDGTCQANVTSFSTNDPMQQCGLFLAESAIPMAGWGMYTGINIEKDAVIPPVDLVIPVYDIDAHRALIQHYDRLELTMGHDNIQHYIHSSTGRHIRYTQRRHVHKPNSNNTSLWKTHPNRLTPLPKWLMHNYYWDCTMTHNFYDAEDIESVVPGLGMLANSHPGMILAENAGPARPFPLGGKGQSASTPYQDQSFLALDDIPAGHEIFVEYGDDWFEMRFDATFGLSRDYDFGNKVAEKWQYKIVDAVQTSKLIEETRKISILQDLSRLMLDIIQPFNLRLHAVLDRLTLAPTSANEKFERLVAKKNPTAYASVPTALKSLEWLQQEGLCLDHITVQDSLVAPGENGAFASRNLPKGTVVAPAPVVHMSRDHMSMLLMDDYDSEMILWKGYQLLLNYVYGHVESSLVFFPYANAVNLINHYGGKGVNSTNADGTKRRPNVKLQWSAKMPHPEWKEWTPDEIVAVEDKAGMVMEIVALEDIPEGAEILLDYGNTWQEAFEEHMETTPEAPELPEVDWEAHALLTENDDKQYPGFVQTVCWIHEDQRPAGIVEQKGELPKTWVTWKQTKTAFLSDSMPCTIVGRQQDGAFYNVIVTEYLNDERGGETEEEVEIKIANIPRKAVTVVPLTYINPELRRDAFRHEIQLPEDMVPEHWRDLKAPAFESEASETCDLYMAESSISEAGLGLYRGYGTVVDPLADNELDRFCQGMVIQVEDFALNQILRNRFLNQKPDLDFDDWMLTRYSWKADVTKGNFEAGDVQSYAPGCGMLAKAHPILYNSQMLPPLRMPSNKTDHTLGATTPYHNTLFVEQYLKKGTRKIRTMQNGNEVFAKYPDSYFHEREDVMGKIPLKSDYVVVDKILQRFADLKEKFGNRPASLVWMLLWHTVKQFDLVRIAAALPENMEEVEKIIGNGGSANYVTPDPVKTQEWLEAHGSCVDNIRPGQSHIEEAGKGALATRKISKGGLIAPLPLLHLHREHLDIYNSDNIEDPLARVYLEGKQLLLNYCLGHPESSLLLLPYSPTVGYINHASAGNANAKLQWSSKFNRKDWLKKSPEDLLKNHKQSGLAMELVATRDLSPGEEIYLDYGSEWENAWEEHKAGWKLSDTWDYEPPENDWLEWIFTEDELEISNQYVQYDREDKWLGCYIQLPEDLPTTLPNTDIDDLPRYEWKMADAMFRSTKDVFPCEITERVVDTDDFVYSMIRKDSVSPLHDVYTAIATVDFYDGKPPRRFMSYNVPRRAIEIFDEEYKAPQFYRDAFRKEIGIPDDLFPKAWRDLKA